MNLSDRMKSVGSFIFGGETGNSYEDMLRQRALAESMQQSMMGRPQNVGQGLQAITAALVARKSGAKADKMASEGRQGASSALASLMGGGMMGQGGAANFLPGGSSSAPGGSNAYRDAIASIESAGSGDYSAVGPTHPRMGRALGRYQIMEANLPQWSQEAIGRQVSPQEFMQNPAVQDAIFDHRFGGYVQKYGPEGAAQAWLGGEGGVGKTGRKDSLGTSIGEYGDRFMTAMGRSPGNLGSAGIGMAPNRIPDSAYAGVGMAPDRGSMSFVEGQQPDVSFASQMGGGMDPRLVELMNNPYVNELPPVQQSALAAMIQSSIARANPEQMTPYQQAQVDMDRQRLAMEQQRAMTPEAERGVVIGGQVVNPVTGEVIYSSPAGAGGEYGLTPVYGTDADGNTVVMQIGKDGSAVQTRLPDGITPDLGVKSREAARGSTIGKAQGEAQMDLPAAISKAERAIVNLEAIRDDPALPGITGMMQGRLPPMTQAGTDLKTRIDQAQGQAFLEAFESLKGGGQITEIEGQKAEAAMARLNRAQSTEAYQAALNDLIDVLRTGMARAQGRAGLPVQSAPQVGPSDDDLLSKYGG